MNENTAPDVIKLAKEAAAAGAPGFEYSAFSGAQVEISAPPDVVWALLTDIEQWPVWNKRVQTAVLDGRLEAGSVFRWKSNGFSVTSTLRDVTPNRRIAWAGVAFGTKAFHSWHIEATNRGAILKTAEWFGGWLPKLMPGAMHRTLNDTLPAWLQAIKKEAESRAR